MDYKWVALSVTCLGHFYGKSGFNHRCHRSADDSTAIARYYLVHGIWIITGYTLMMTILLVLLGRLADLYGRVRLYNLGFAIFTVGSLLCALSQNGAQLVAFRFLQGAGAALLYANSGAIITDAFPADELGMGLGINVMAVNLGAIAGYTLGGVMITYFGWQSIFLA